MYTITTYIEGRIQYVPLGAPWFTPWFTPVVNDEQKFMIHLSMLMMKRSFDNCLSKMTNRRFDTSDHIFDEQNLVTPLVHTWLCGEVRVTLHFNCLCCTCSILCFICAGLVCPVLPLSIDCPCGFL
jgi:hypothetical protein